MTRIASLLAGLGTLAVASACGAAAAEPVTVLTFQARLTPVAVSGPAEPKGMTVQWLVADDPAGRPPRSAFLVTEESDALPWPDRFGLPAAAANEAERPVSRFGYRFGKQNVVLPLPGWQIALPAVTQIGSTWRLGSRTVTVAGDGLVENHPTWTLNLSGPPGRLATATVDQHAVGETAGLLRKWGESVVLGRGDRFRLTLGLTEEKPPAAETAGRTAALFSDLAALRAAVPASADGQSPALSAEQTASVREIAGRLSRSTAGTPFAALVPAIERDLADRAKQGSGLEKLAADRVGQPLPKLKLTGPDGRPFDLAPLRGKVVVLHLWEYDPDAMAAPYGQVGYLDFLSRKRADDGVAMLGVAVGAPGATTEKTRLASGRLAAMMNLSYPVTADDGTGLAALGDPRKFDQPLPLWVVVDAAGTVREYKAGLFETRPNRGLEDLDRQVEELVKERDAQLAD